MLSLVPRPVLALILVFLISKRYEEEKRLEESVNRDSDGSGEAEDCIWLKQTINNACGFYGILHAVCNGVAKNIMVTSQNALWAFGSDYADSP